MYEKHEVQFEIQKNPCGFGLAMTVYAKDYDGNTVFVARDMTMEKVEPGTFLIQPTCSFSIQSGQSLMDALWNCGIRPTEGMGSAGSFTAQQAHLNDMKAIAFAALEKAGVKCQSR